jgi:hypothetical protein
LPQIKVICLGQVTAVEGFRDGSGVWSPVTDVDVTQPMENPELCAAVP